jgi:hypothetical protein
MQEWHDPIMFAVDDVQIESIQLGDISLGKKYTQKSNWRNSQLFKTVRVQEKHTLQKQPN